MKLFLCSACNRHVKDADATCPFCGADVAGAAVALMMTNCSSSSAYGGPDAHIEDAGPDGD